VPVDRLRIEEGARINCSCRAHALKKSIPDIRTYDGSSLAIALAVDVALNSAINQAESQSIRQAATL
jgi:hypothetical protein